MYQNISGKPNSITTMITKVAEKMVRNIFSTEMIWDVLLVIRKKNPV
jgi:hypothetical protein